jgi:hypothetical protein
MSGVVSKFSIAWKKKYIVYIAAASFVNKNNEMAYCYCYAATKPTP